MVPLKDKKGTSTWNSLHGYPRKMYSYNFDTMHVVGETVLAALVERVFSIFGSPGKLHSDNGAEFNNRLLKAFVEQVLGCQFVRGRPRTPQSQVYVSGIACVLNRMAFPPHSETYLCLLVWI
jgi:hypothetical protein